MLQNPFLLVACVVGFLVPVGAATLFVGLPSYADPGLPDGFEPVGELTVYYVGGG
jgi:hypothetical protein